MAKLHRSHALHARCRFQPGSLPRQCCLQQHVAVDRRRLELPTWQPKQPRGEQELVELELPKEAEELGPDKQRLERRLLEDCSELLDPVEEKLSKVQKSPIA